MNSRECVAFRAYRQSTMFLALVILLLSSSAGAAGVGKWVRTSKELAFSDKDGTIVTKFTLGQTEKNLSHHPEQKFTDRMFISTKAGVSSNGDFAWVLMDETFWLVSGEKATVTFRYYGKNGQMLWEKYTVTGVNATADGKAIALLEIDPKWIAANEHRNSPGRPRIYSSDGELLFEFGECRSNFTPYFSKNGRYGAVVCDSASAQKSAVVFDLSKKVKKEISIPAVGIAVAVRDDGTYALVTSQQKFDPVTKKYGEFVTEEILHGRIE